MFIRKKYFVLVWLVLIFVTGLISINAQKNPSNMLYAEPTRLMFAGDEKENEEFENGNLLREHFYPIGWSKDGKFAYFYEPADEACDCYFAGLIIQDMRTDKVLWSRSYDSGFKEDDDNRKPVTLAAYWKQNRKLFSRKLAEYKIVADKNFNLRAFPFDLQTDRLTADLTADLTEEDATLVKGNVRLDLISKQKGKKTLYAKKYFAKDYESIRVAEIGGFLLSPFEPRAAIILIETHRGWEGPPNVTQTNIVGADLMNGFH